MGISTTSQILSASCGPRHFQNHKYCQNDKYCVSLVIFLPTEGHRAPGEAGTKAGKEQMVAAADAAGAQGFVEG